MKKYLTLRPWHFDKGASFSVESFLDYQRKAQRWADSAWVYFTMISIIPYIILAFSISVPRARKAKVAAARLGVTSQEINTALKRLKNGVVAYEPSQAERDLLENIVKKERTDAKKRIAENKPKTMKIWGIVLAAMGAVVFVKSLTDLVAGNMPEEIGQMAAGAAVFCGIGIFLMIRAKKITNRQPDERRHK